MNIFLFIFNINRLNSKNKNHIENYIRLNTFRTNDNYLDNRASGEFTLDDIEAFKTFLKGLTHPVLIEYKDEDIIIKINPDFEYDE